MALNCGLLGLGIMGKPFLKHLLKAGYQVPTWNRTMPKVLEIKNELKGSPEYDLLQPKEHPIEVIKASNQILIALFDGPSIFEVIKPLPDDLIADKMFICTSTISLFESKELHRLISSKKGIYIESPVLGNHLVAEAAKLQILVGATEKNFQKATPILKLFGNPKHIGDVGKGIALKLTLNQILASSIAMFATSLAVIEKEGVPVDKFMDVILSGPFGNPNYHPTWKSKMTSHNYSDVAFKLEGMKKDVHLFSELVEDLDLDMTYISGLCSFYDLAARVADPNQDFSSVYEAASLETNK